MIYRFEPSIRGDIHLYLPEELPGAGGGPFTIVWDNTGALRKWLDALPGQEPSAPDRGEAVHEDERFWAWLV